MSITTLQQSTEVTGVGMVTISDIVEDTTNDVFIREIKVFGEADSSGGRTLIFTLRLSAIEEDSVVLNAPAQTF